MDEAALAQLADEVVTAQFRGLPDGAYGGTVGEFAGGGHNLFDGGFWPPVVVLLRSALDHNLDTMAAYCAERGVELAPHGKTTMAPRVHAAQLRRGAWGITAATPSQVRVYRRFGVPRVLLANELVEPAAIRWLAAEHAADPGFDFWCYVDSPAGVRRLAEGWDGSGPMLPVLIEMGFAGGRTGCRDVAAAVEVAEEVAGRPGLVVAGVSGFEGTIGDPATGGNLARARAFLTQIGAVADRLAADGLFGVPEPVVSAGGSAYFDLVTDAFAGSWAAERGMRVLLRSGCYLAHEAGRHAGGTPFVRRGGPYELRPALRAWGEVLSTPEPGRALVSFGRRDVSFDAGLPTPVELRRAGGTTETAGGIRVTALNDQHAFVSGDLAVGDWLGCEVSHACTTFDKWRLIPVVDDDGTVVDAIRTFF